MAITTANDLINFALRATGIAGSGQTASAEDANDALTVLTTMLAQWQTKRWLVPDDVELVLTSTGAASYSVGPARPNRVESAFVRILPTQGSNTFDYSPLYLIRSREEYNSISLKALSTIPSAVFFDTAWPIGQLYFWPVPPASLYELHVTFKNALPEYAALTDVLNLPPEYAQALQYGLCVMLASNYGLEPRPVHVQAFRAGLATIRAANFQMRPARLPGALVGRGGYPSYGQLVGGVW